MTFKGIPYTVNTKNTEIKKGMYKCSKCNGLGEIPDKTVVIYKPCNCCGGSGRIDWIDYCLNKSKTTPITKRIIVEICKNNIANLKVLLKEQEQLKIIMEA